MLVIHWLWWLICEIQNFMVILHKRDFSPTEKVQKSIVRNKSVIPDKPRWSNFLLAFPLKSREYLTGRMQPKWSRCFVTGFRWQRCLVISSRHIFLLSISDSWEKFLTCLWLSPLSWKAGFFWFFFLVFFCHVSIAFCTRWICVRRKHKVSVWYNLKWAV